MTNRKYLIALLIAILTTQPIIVAMQAHQPPVVVVQQDQSSRPVRVFGVLGTAFDTVLGWTGMLLGKIMWNRHDGTINNLRRSASTLLLGVAVYDLYAAGKFKAQGNQSVGKWMKELREKGSCIGMAALCGFSGLLMHPGILPYA